MGQVDLRAVKLEKDIQALIEQNMETFSGSDSLIPNI